jgi:hypothetical protein
VLIHVLCQWRERHGCLLPTPPLPVALQGLSGDAAQGLALGDLLPIGPDLHVRPELAQLVAGIHCAVRRRVAPSVLSEPASSMARTSSDGQRKEICSEG